MTKPCHVLPHAGFVSGSRKIARHGRPRGGPGGRCFRAVGYKICSKLSKWIGHIDGFGGFSCPFCPFKNNVRSCCVLQVPSRTSWRLRLALLESFHSYVSMTKGFVNFVWFQFKTSPNKMYQQEDGEDQRGRKYTYLP